MPPFFKGGTGLIILVLINITPLMFLYRNVHAVFPTENNFALLQYTKYKVYEATHCTRMKIPVKILSFDSMTKYLELSKLFFKAHELCLSSGCEWIFSLNSSFWLSL